MFYTVYLKDYKGNVLCYYVYSEYFALLILYIEKKKTVVNNVDRSR